jgi:hypothetical protein
MLRAARSPLKRVARNVLTPALDDVALDCRSRIKKKSPASPRGF